MSNERPDGYCAWHPDKGFRADLLSADIDGAINAACCSMGYQEDSDFGGGAIDVDDFTKDGWQVRPVYLVSPAEKHQHERLKEWASNVVGYIEAMITIQNTSVHAKQAKRGVVDMEVENELLKTYQQIMSAQGEK